MRLATIVSLAASALLGVGALVVAKVALPNAASAKNPAGATVTAGAPLVVASRAIKYGEKLQPEMLTVINVPATATPEGSFTRVSDVLAVDHGGAPVVLFPMSAREPVLPSKLSGPGARPTVAAEIAEGMRAYTIKVTDVSGVGGHALPGDYVDVVLTRDLTPEGGQRNFVSYVVLQNVRMLGVDLNANLQSDKPASPNTATLEVSVEDTQKLSVAVNLGSLSLALRRTGNADLGEAPPLRTSDFLVGGRPSSVGRTVANGPAPRPGIYSAILIVEGQGAKRARSARKLTSQTPTPTLNGATAAPAAGGSAAPAAS